MDVFVNVLHNKKLRVHNLQISNKQRFSCIKKRTEDLKSYADKFEVTVVGLNYVGNSFAYHARNPSRPNCKIHMFFTLTCVQIEMQCSYAIPMAFFSSLFIA